MIAQLSYVGVECPMCGRQVHVSQQYLGQEVLCSHCQGRFCVHEKAFGEYATSSRGRERLLARAQRLLDFVTPVASSHAGDVLCQRRGYDDEKAAGSSGSASRRKLTQIPKPRQEQNLVSAQKPGVILVEHRDEVFARLAMDLAKAGMNVRRTETAAEAIPLFARHTNSLVLANLIMPDQSGWLLAGKLHFIDPNARVWLYHPRSSRYAERMADFLMVDQLLEYQGDLLGLSEMVIALVASRHKRSLAKRALPANEEQTAA